MINPRNGQTRPLLQQIVGDDTAQAVPEKDDVVVGLGHSVLDSVERERVQPRVPEVTLDIVEKEANDDVPGVEMLIEDGGERVERIEADPFERGGFGLDASNREDVTGDLPLKLGRLCKRGFGYRLQLVGVRPPVIAVERQRHRNRGEDRGADPL